MTYTINTAKGSMTSTDLAAICAWQAEMQGAAATINGADVDHVDFDAEDLAATVAAVSVAIEADAAGYTIGMAVEADDGTAESYDTGRILAIRRGQDGVLDAEVGWDSGARNWCMLTSLRG